MVTEAKAISKRTSQFDLFFKDCNVEPNLQNVLKNLQNNIGALESVLASNKYAFTGGVLGLNITNGGAQMMTVGNILSTNMKL